MKLYITASFGDSQENIEQLCSYVKEAGYVDFCFIRDVENYQKIFDDPKELMQRALEEVKSCDALLIDMTDKPTGRMIEAGWAHALGKKIFVIMKQGTVLKDTTRGIADVIIEYKELKDIVKPLQQYARK